MSIQSLAKAIQIFYNLSSWPIHKPSMRFLDLCYNKAEDNFNNITH